MAKSDSRRDAMQVILEIVRQSPGDSIVGKVKLFKAFYLAHLFYARNHAGYLTDWPIVKMPHGPGIDRFDELLHGLLEAGVIETSEVPVGPYKAVKFKATGKALPGAELPAEAARAVSEADEFVATKKGAQLSDITHEFSTSWNEAKLGDELNIYIDLLSDEEHEARRQQAGRLKEEISAVFG